jgi:hypothetical protein
MASLPRAVALLLLLAPAGWWLGLTPGYLAHHLYSDDDLSLTVCTAVDGEFSCEEGALEARAMAALGVPHSPGRVCHLDSKNSSANDSEIHTGAHA